MGSPKIVHNFCRHFDRRLQVPPILQHFRVKTTQKSDRVILIVDLSICINFEHYEHRYMPLLS